MKHLVSTAYGALLRQHDIPTALAMLHKAGYDAVDFNLCTYCEAPDRPMYQENWREWVKGIRDLMDENHLVVGQIHSHWKHETQVNEDFSFDPPEQVIYDNFEAAAILGCKRLIFHPIQRFYRLPDAADRQKVLDACVAWFRYLLPTAEKWGVEIHIENLFDHKHVQLEGDPFLAYCTADDILYVVNQLNHPLVKICLDTGHANINKQDIGAMIRQFGDKLGSLHLNDNFGKIGPIYEDVHMLPGDGRINWKEVFAALHEIGYEGTLNMEPSASLQEQAPNIQFIRIKAARDVVAALMENAQNGL